MDALWYKFLCQCKCVGQFQSLVLTGIMFNYNVQRIHVGEAISKLRWHQHELNKNNPSFQKQNKKEGVKPQMYPNLSLKLRLRINKQTKVRCSAHTGPQMPLTAWGPGPCFILGAVVPFPTTSCSGGALVLFRKSTSSSALVSGISEENMGYSEREYLI